MSILKKSSTSTRSRLLGGFVALSLSAALGACVGDTTSGPGDPPDDGPQRIPSSEDGVDERLDGLDIICESTMNVTGTYVAGAAQPADVLGCWPVGTWTLSATIDRLGCDPQPLFVDNEFTETYVYEVTHDAENAAIQVGFVNDPSDERVNLKISTAGDSLCHGAMDHYNLDGTVIGFRPTLQLDGTLQGIGTYTRHKDDTF
jgi:hypothetical protein